MKKKLLALLIGIVILVLALFVLKPAAEFTNLIIKNSSKEDSVKVYVTLQYPNSVMGLFGITDTISLSKGTFYALKGQSYSSNTDASLLGVVVSFVGDNVPCDVAISRGFKSGINIFECSINTKYEVFDISCEDGDNCTLKTSVSDSLWTTGDAEHIALFTSAQNRIEVGDNLNIRGVFPYRCTDCKDMVAPIPLNCFNLKDTCNTARTCQVARTGKRGGSITCEYKGSFVIN